VFVEDIIPKEGEHKDGGKEGGKRKEMISDGQEMLY
jgi:hypothetical protein